MVFISVPRIGAPKWGGGMMDCRPPDLKRNLKYIYFVDTLITKVLRDLGFSLNQPLTSADE